MITKKIAIFGSGGLLGTDLVSIGSRYGQILSYHRDLDLRQKDLLWKQLKMDEPSVVINAAGQSNVDASEKDPEEAFALNCHGPKNLADICSDLNIPLVHFSTDYVFPGNPEHIYVETDVPAPVNQYGKSKAAGEIEVGKWSQHYILRVSSLFGWSRENHATRVLSAIKTGQKIKIATDMVCSPTYTVSVAEMTFKLINNKSPYGVYHMLCSGHCSRYEFAQMLCGKMKIPQFNLIEPISISDMRLPARRPEFLMLSIDKLSRTLIQVPSWEQDIDKFLYLGFSENVAPKRVFY